MELLAKAVGKELGQKPVRLLKKIRHNPPQSGISGQAERRANATETAGKLRGKMINMQVKCGAQGRLYGSITSAEVAAELKKQHGVEIDKRDIKCENIRTVGDVEIEVRVYKDINAKMTVHVEPIPAK